MVKSKDIRTYFSINYETIKYGQSDNSSKM